MTIQMLPNNEPLNSVNQIATMQMYGWLFSIVPSVNKYDCLVQHIKIEKSKGSNHGFAYNFIARLLGKK